MRRWAGTVIGELRERDLSGFRYSRRAPRAAALNGSACGTKVSSGPHGRCGGICPGARRGDARLAIEEEGRLNDPGLREHFVDRVFGHARVRDFFAGRWTAESMIRFHSAEKAAVMAHDVEAARRLGRLVTATAVCTASSWPGATASSTGPPSKARDPRPAGQCPHAPGWPPQGRSRIVRPPRALRGDRGLPPGLVLVAVPLALLSRHLAPPAPSGPAPRHTYGPIPKGSA